MKMFLKNKHQKIEKDAVTWTKLLRKADEEISSYWLILKIIFYDIESFKKLKINKQIIFKMEMVYTS